MVDRDLAHHAAAAPVRRLGTTDLAECVRLSEDRGWAPEREKWRLLFEVGDVYGIDAPDGGLAGAVVATRYGDQTAVISMMLVAQRHERRGLGGRLLRHALEHTGTAGFFLHATDFGLPLYERLGFRTVGRCTSYSGTFDGPAGSGPVRRSRPATEADLPAIHALDAEVFGAPRTGLLDRLPSFCRELRVVEGPGGIAGFGGAWPNDNNTVIGPVTAQDQDTAVTLVSDLAAAVDGPVRLDIDHRHPELLEWAGKAGFAARFSTTVMEHGTPLPADQSRLFVPVMMALG
ncbi:GNAT family N-acetyltransferase [Streptomyces sp. NPDC048506]|uniref:GNAT family N-acetyltransferase n=1 Tax=Streptomyces sp. NPDC048506 TaxID=3155028 RepID=UPI00343A407E